MTGKSAIVSLPSIQSHQNISRLVPRMLLHSILVAGSVIGSILLKCRLHSHFESCDKNSFGSTLVLMSTLLPHRFGISHFG